MKKTSFGAIAGQVLTINAGHYEGPEVYIIDPVHVNSSRTFPTPGKRNKASKRRGKK